MADEKAFTSKDVTLLGDLQVWMKLLRDAVGNGEARVSGRLQHQGEELLQRISRAALPANSCAPLPACDCDQKASAGYFVGGDGFCATNFQGRHNLRSGDRYCNLCGAEWIPEKASVPTEAQCSWGYRYDNYGRLDRRIFSAEKRASPPDDISRVLLQEVCDTWVNGRRVLDGIPLELRQQVDAALRSDTMLPTIKEDIKVGCTLFRRGVKLSIVLTRLRRSNSPESEPDD